METIMFRATTVLLALVLAAPAMAGDLSYNYLQVGYQKAELDVDGFDIDGDGFGIGGSFELNDNFFALVDYGTADFDFDVEASTLSAGVGYHSGISPTTDFFVALSFVKAEVEIPGFGSVDEDGFGATIGLRGMISDQVELFGAVSYVDLGNDDNTSIGGGAWYKLTDTFALGANLQTDEDVTSYGVAARLHFGQ